MVGAEKRPRAFASSAMKKMVKVQMQVTSIEKRVRKRRKAEQEARRPTLPQTQIGKVVKAAKEVGILV